MNRKDPIPRHDVLCHDFLFLPTDNNFIFEIYISLPLLSFLVQRPLQIQILRPQTDMAPRQ